MVDYTKSTGATGTMTIRDLGTNVEFWLQAGSGTFNHDLPWAFVINGVTSPWKEFDFVSGGAMQRLLVTAVNTTQTVTFKLGDTGTVGLGGPTTFSHLISRATVPAVPSTPALSSLTATSVFVSFSDGANGGAAIDSRQIGYGTNGTTPSSTVASDGSDTVSGLTPGTTYYFWARTHNSKGYSAWSARSQVTTPRGPDAPNAPSLSSIGPTSMVVTWSPNYDGGAPITGYELGYGTNSSAPITVISASSPRTVSGLIPGTRYYFWVSASNSAGQSGWSPSVNAETIAGARIMVGGVWRIAIPYVRQGGVWRLARPWVRNSGVWKETI
jgi:hypothetical protein